MGAPASLTSLKLRIFGQQQLSALPAAVPLIYLLGILCGLDDQQILEMAARWAPGLFLLVAMIAPWVLIHVLTESALRRLPGDAPGARLNRILTLPRKFEVGTILCGITGIAIYAAAACLTYDRPLALVVPAILVSLSMLLLISARQILKVEELLRPHAVEELEEHPDVRPGQGGFFQARQLWYRPYVTLVVILATLVSLGVIVVRRVQSFVAGWGAELRQRGHQQIADELPEQGYRLLGSLLMPTAVILGFVVILGTLAALALARRQRAGTRAVEEAAKAMASGSYALPAWPATDELGDLAFATASAVAALERKAHNIASSARILEEVARDLAVLVMRQQQVLGTQSSVLHQTQATAHEIKQASELASEKASKVLSAAESAEKVGRSGRATLESSLGQLRAILSQVSEMSGFVGKLEQRARQIGRITMVVKDLADQSNMVALNAAIEATRAGESGKAFSVVAQQIRRLSNESMSATDQVQQMLQDVQGAIRQVVALSGAGVARAGSGLELTRAWGEDMRRLSEIVEDNAAAARQISLAVTQQSAGIAEIFEALNLLGSTMGETVSSMKATEAITGRAQRAAREVASAMTRSQQQAPGASPAGDGRV